MLNFGGFLSSNFWTNYRCQSSASIEDLLNSKGCTVEKLLDDDDCLQELKNFNKKLIKFFDHDKLKVLIDYITVMPADDDGHERGHKFPFIAGEIFNCEINEILDKFFEAPERPVPEQASDKDENEESEDKSGQQSTPNEGNEEATPQDDKAEEEKAGAAKDLEKEGASAQEEQDKAQAEDNQQQEAGNNPQEEQQQESSEGAKDAELAEPQAEKPTEAGKEEAAQEESKEGSSQVTAGEGAAQQIEAKETAPEQQNSQEPEAEEQQEKPAETKAEAPSQPAKEPEAEKENQGEDRKEDSHNEEGLLEQDTQESTQQTTLATEAAEDEAEYENQYLLLDRLFKFIEPEEELNAVLSGYFCKLVSLLISRKQKFLIPYIFSTDREIIHNLVKHMGQKSISEILNKLMTQIDHDHENMQSQIQEAQKMVVEQVVGHLGADKDEENNLNACSIIQDMFETKEFYNILVAKDTFQTIANFATAGIDESTKASKTSSLTVLNQIITQHIEKIKKKEGSKDEQKDTNNDEDDDMIIQQTSDDEKDDLSNPLSVSSQTNSMVEALLEKIPQIERVLRPDRQGKETVGSVCDAPFTPLGQQRLRSVDLVLNMIKLRKDTLLKAIGESTIFTSIIELVKQYPWNNFLQLKVINICNEVISGSHESAFRAQFLEKSGIAKAFVEMSQTASYELESSRTIRNGYMALVISVATKLQARYDGTDENKDQVVADYLDEAGGEEWRAFVDDELKKSNENNNKTLGGCTRNSASEDNDEGENSNYDVQMEKIMQRFSNFNQILSETSGQDDDDDDEDEEQNEYIKGEINDEDEGEEKKDNPTPTAVAGESAPNTSSIDNDYS